jgi:hypothetical protein
MKLAVLLSALLLGLSAQVEAAAGKAIESAPASFEPALTGPDLDFNLQSVNDALLDTEEDEPELIATSIDSANIDLAAMDVTGVDLTDVSLAEVIADDTPADEIAFASEALLVAGQHPSASRRVPEPPPAALAAIGLGLLGLVALGRRIRGRKRHARRRRVLLEMREIISER